VKFPSFVAFYSARRSPIDLATTTPGAHHPPCVRSRPERNGDDDDDDDEGNCVAARELSLPETQPAGGRTTTGGAFVYGGTVRSAWYEYDEPS
jgi:hypothetical protein